MMQLKDLYRFDVQRGVPIDVSGVSFKGADSKRAVNKREGEAGHPRQ